jgi:hypothetical protein
MPSATMAIILGFFLIRGINLVLQWSDFPLRYFDITKYNVYVLCKYNSNAEKPEVAR